MVTGLPCLITRMMSGVSPQAITPVIQYPNCTRNGYPPAVCNCGKPGKGLCYNCIACGSCINCPHCTICSQNGPPPPYLPVPPEWVARKAAGQLLYSLADPQPGLHTSIGNGFISGDTGCSSKNRGSCGQIHVAGVFEGVAGHQNRARLPNPFAVTTDATHLVGAALDIERGLYTNRTGVLCEAGLVQIEITTYTHRTHRSLLVTEIHAPGLAIGDKCTVRLMNCTLSDFSDFNVTTTASGAKTFVVRTMESPPYWSSMHAPPRTVVGYAAQKIPESGVLLTGPTRAIFVAAYHTSLEPGLESQGSAVAAAEADVSRWGADGVTETLLQSHLTAQAELWTGGIEVDGNATVAGTVNSSLYYILSAARADWPYGLSPGGLSRTDYEGHSFWDCETWMFPNTVALYPELALSLTEYRHARLSAARERAVHHGYGGAMQPWESALLGFGVSAWSIADDYEIHISGDVPMAFRQYFRMTQNSTWLRTRGWEMARDSANFFASRVVRHTETGNWTLLNVIMPDESAGVRNSSAYTNAIAGETMRFAAATAAKLQLPAPSNWTEIADKMYLPIVELAPGLRVHPEFEGYTTKVRPYINQADVALMQYPLGMTMSSDVAFNDLLYYQARSSGPRTAGFYTGDSAYSIAWLQHGNRSAADAQFDLAFTHMDMTTFNVWKEKNFGSGGNLNFITGAGGYLQNFVYGYAGLRYDFIYTRSICLLIDFFVQLTKLSVI